jgi:antibiotic biosynthesis monooxygenase (ABM) superfamily enzyme
VAARRAVEPPDPVTVTVARKVAVGREADFEDWSDELTAVAANYPGFLGAGRLRPSHVGQPWHVVFRFDSAEHLAAWEGSPERRAMLEVGEDLIEATDMHRVSGLETWFSLPGRTAPAPPKWKMFLVSATVFYLLNLTLTLIYGWSLESWPLPLHIVLISVPVTAIATWLVMPRAARLLQRWLFAAPRADAVPAKRMP